MAKSSGKNPIPSRIRFAMVEAEIGDGDIAQFTQAIQNALRSPHAPVKRIAATVTNPTPEPDAEVEEETSADDLEGDSDAAPPRSKQAGPRKPPATPDFVPIDMNAEMSLADFVKGKDVASQNKKYLVAAAWLKEHRNINAVNASHIYTCFRSMQWSTSIPDFWQPLRNLKAKRFFTKNDQDEYEINHIGLDYVIKLGGKNGTA